MKKALDRSRSEKQRRQPERLMCWTDIFRTVVRQVLVKKYGAVIRFGDKPPFYKTLFHTQPSGNVS